LKKAVLVLAVLTFSASLSAQLRTGHIYGRIADKQGNPLPGVTVTLTGSQVAKLTTVTNGSGIYRFPSIYPASDYGIKAELVGFKTAIRANIIVTVGRDSEIDLVLEVGKFEEEVTATAVMPVVDAKGTTETTVVDRSEMQSLPTTRDPWAILQLVPSVMLDRENVGGNESGRQASFVAKGDDTNGANNLWAIDGVDITDPADLGASAIFPDFDTFEQLNITTGGAADVNIQTGGIALNIVTRRGGNKVSLSSRFYLTDNFFQSDNLTDALRAQGVTNTNRIQQIKDFGINVGGPIVKNRLWWWGAYGVQDIFNYTLYDTKDQAQLTSYNFKINAQPFSGNRFEAMVVSGEKEIYGLNASLAKPEGDHQAGVAAFGDPIFKIQDEQAINKNFFISLKYSYNHTGTRLRPALDEALANPVTWDVGNQAYVPFSSDYGRSWDWNLSSRSKSNFQFMATLFRDSALGVSHEIKAGLEFSTKEESSRWGYFQNFEVERNFTAPLIDLGEGLVVPPANWQYIRFGRESRDDARVRQASGYLQDTIVKGRFTLTLGLRFDRQQPSLGALTLETVKGTANAAWAAVFDASAMTALNADCPPLSVNAIKPKYYWNTWSPRIGLNWDITGDGKTVAKLGLSQYGDVMAVGAYATRPLGLGGGMGFWWDDTSGDNKVQLGEIFWQYSSAHADTPYQLYGLYDSTSNLTEAAVAALVGGFGSDAYLAGNYWDYDWSNPAAVDYEKVTTFFRSDIDPDAKSVKSSPRTREILLGLEREVLPDLSLSLNATYRRYDNFDWAKPFYPADIYPETPDLVIDNTQEWYTAAGTIPDSVVIGDVTYSLKDAAGKTWYLPVETYPGPTPYRMIDKSEVFRTYLGFDLVVNKRLADRWFLNASITLQDQRVHWGDSFIDPTNQWALDGQPFGNWGSGSPGKVPVQMYARWMTKISGLYQLPWGFNVSGTLIAREGWKIPNYITLAYAGNDPWPGLYKSNTVYIQVPTKDSLPTMANLSFRLEKRISVGAGRMYLMADVFNVLNSAVVNRAYDANIGTYYVNTEEAVANPTYRRYNEILNPRIWRFGVRFEF
jgi:hypothetical protein